MRPRLKSGFILVASAALAAGCDGGDPAGPGGATDAFDQAGARDVEPETSGGKIAATPFVASQLLVKFKPGTSATTTESAHRALGARVMRSYRSVRDLHLVKIPDDRAVREAAAEYAQMPGVAYAEPNYIWQPVALPDDPDIGELYGMHNTGQTGGTEDADINAAEAWDEITGDEQVVIADIDTGIDYDHEDLVGNLFVNPGEIPANGIDDDDNGYVDDVHGINTIANTGDPMDDVGHGTHTAGTIAAQGDNGIGVAGVNWDAKILSCKFLGAFGGSTDGAIACLDYLVQMKTRAENPVNIVASNNSWGGGGFSQALRDAIDQNRSAGILFVAAAGNDGRDTDVTPSFPQGYDLPNILSVGATDHDDGLASFSNFGARSVDVMAPGVGVLSTTPGDSYDAFDGTSMATPHVTGLVGLLKAQDPNRDWIALRNLVLTGGTPIEAAADTSLTGRRIRAWDEGGVGSLTCEDQVLVRRAHPVKDVLSVSAGETVNLAVLSIDCADAHAEGATVTLEETGEVFQLADDGTGTDGAAGDGVFSAGWNAPDAGTFHFTFSNGETVTVSVVQNYGQAAEVASDYRDIEGTALDLGDDTTQVVQSPFPIQFAGGAGFEELFVGSNGTISFTDQVTPFFNGALPTDAFETLVAPLWDDHSPQLSASDGVYTAVVGEAPNRELVIEWRDVAHFNCREGAVTFQTVLFEGSSRILFQYDDTSYENPQCDDGVQGTVGVQVAPGVARQFSFSEPVLGGDTALLWQLFGAPVANTGGEQVVEPGAEVVLDGAGSTDPDGEITAFQWSQVAGAPVDLAGANAAEASFVAPEESGTLTFELQVTDDEGNVGFGVVDVFVNRPPTADAGPDQVGGTSSPVQLDGNASGDADGDIAGFSWVQLDGAPVALESSGTATPRFTAPDETGILIFELTVTDDQGSVGIDHVAVTVEDNALPVASAGPGQLVGSGESVTLDGTRSSDADGALASYAWEQVRGDAIDLTGADTATPSFTAPATSGVLEFRITVTDAFGASDTDVVEVAVFDQNPVADAGADQVVQPGAAVVLDGSASADPDGEVTEHAWQQIAGPSVTLDGANEPVASLAAPQASGTLRFMLTVTDEDGLVGSDTIDVVVNQLPLADTGGDRNVREGSTVVLDGTDSRDLDGEIVGYQWTQTGGPSVALQGGTTPTPSFVAPATGDEVYVTVTLELTVTDEHGATATGTAEVLILDESVRVAL